MRVLCVWARGAGRVSPLVAAGAASANTCCGTMRVRDRGVRVCMSARVCASMRVFVCTTQLWRRSLQWRWR